MNVKRDDTKRHRFYIMCSLNKFRNQEELFIKVCSLIHKKLTLI